MLSKPTAKERWGWDRKNANRIIEAKNLNAVLTSRDVKRPSTESQLREIATLIKTDRARCFVVPGQQD
jgi:hypothetical protein